MNNPQQDLIFALDIGTRSVIGVVGQARGEMFHVLYMAKEEHSKRAMLDGQIEDIDQVAKVVNVVKHRLEEQVGQRLTRVCVAAAGRSLRMERARALVELPEIQTVTDDFISQLEAVAIAEAEAKLSEHHKDQRFYLVGYTVAQYLLDRYPMTTIKGHNGRIMEAEVVATFLPSQVVEGLYSVVHLAGMEVASLTLEPIAALNATIPPDLRLLNLVLVDIGAGTSDIAVCRDGSVVGYTMATTAGDEITEMLMKHFLIDFRTAENFKTCMSAGDIKYLDVLGLEQSTTGHQITEAVAEASKSLVKEIAKEIRAINGCSPSAVFMAGGGSKLEGVSELLAGYLEIPGHRIAVAGSNYSRTVVSENYELEDPEFATPLGIAVSAALGLINDSYHITLNGKGAKLFRSGSLTLLDILMMNGFTAAALIGRTGKNLAIMINGNKKIIRGKPSVPGILRLNGEPAVAGALVSAGDNIEFTPAIDGLSASCTLQELLGDYAGKVLLNGEEVPWDTLLSNGDSIATVNSTGVSVTAMRRGPRPLSANELKPVDAQGNPVELAEHFYKKEENFVSESSQEYASFAPDMMNKATPLPEDNDVKIFHGGNITPIPIGQAETPAPQEVPIHADERAVLKPIPDNLVQPVIPMEPQAEQHIAPIIPLETPAPPVQAVEMPVAPAPVEAPVQAVEIPVAPAPKVEAPVQAVEIPVAPAPKVEAPVQGVEMPVAPAPKVEAPVQAPAAPVLLREPVLEHAVFTSNEPDEPLNLMEQLPVEEKAVMPTGPLPVIPPSMIEDTPKPMVKEEINKVPEIKTPEPIREIKPKDSLPPMEEIKPSVSGEKAPEENKSNVSLTQGTVVLNGKTIQLPPKVDGSPYYLMDLLDKTDIDFRRVTKPILMLVNGKEGFFVQHLHQNDDIIIEEQN